MTAAIAKSSDTAKEQESRIQKTGSEIKQKKRVGKGDRADNSSDSERDGGMDDGGTRVGTFTAGVGVGITGHSSLSGDRLYSLLAESD
ncbi:hypothetical protein EV182_006898, partial [Spiromyces aspiralis]